LAPKAFYVQIDTLSLIRLVSANLELIIPLVVLTYPSCYVLWQMKTGCVALVLCLNVGVDPPDVIKISPCARMECWIGESILPVYLVRVGCDNSAGEGYPGVECLIIITCSLSRHLIQISK
jgi:hypothetical protein